MKKLALAAAIAATVSVGAQATTYTITSTITGSQVFSFGSSDLETANSMVFSGTIEIDGVGAGSAWSVSTDQLGARASLTGSQAISTNDTELTYNLTGDSSRGYVYNDGNGGIVFNGGNIDITTAGTPYGTIDASVDNVHFDGTGNWEGLLIGGIDMSGGTINGDGTITIAFSGLHTGPQPLGFGSGFAAGKLSSGTFTLFDTSYMMRLEGELTLTAVSEVPVPAAVWLFSSALLGLAGIKRRTMRTSPRDNEL